MAQSKYQKFTIATINRADIKNAEYNPRIMDKEAKKRLKAGLKKHGLVSTLTWNKRTGNLVGGHQRLEQLDALEKNKDYSLDVCVIDVDEAEEAGQTGLPHSHLAGSRPRNGSAHTGGMR